MIMHDIPIYVDNSYVLFVCNVSDFDLSKYNVFQPIEEGLYPSYIPSCPFIRPCNYNPCKWPHGHG